MTSISGSSNISYSVNSDVDYIDKVNPKLGKRTSTVLTIYSKQGNSTFKASLAALQGINGVGQSIFNNDGVRAGSIFRDARGYYVYGFNPNVQDPVTNFKGTKDGCSFDLNGVPVVESTLKSGLDITPDTISSGDTKSWGSYDAADSSYTAFGNEFVSKGTTTGFHRSPKLPDGSQQSLVNFVSPANMSVLEIDKSYFSDIIK